MTINPLSNNCQRCAWVTDDPLYQDYHDQEWGVASYGDQYLFKMLCLEGAQAGLSWLTVLKKRRHYEKVFDQFDAVQIAQYNEAKIETLLADPGIIRNRLKVNAFITNAKAYLDLIEEQSLSEFLWQFVDGKPLINTWHSHAQIPATTAQSEAMSRALKQRGFKFVGPTICYAFMQATGMVMDHTSNCFRYAQLCE